ncbi:MAG TPA: hypothetical protein VIK95_15715 [Egibacteraceae bacterium]
MWLLLLALVSQLRGDDPDGEAGFSTAELLGNAALGIAALIAIWGVLQVLGIDVVNWIRSSIMGAGS